MPIYEYLCRDCNKRFERIRPMKDADAEIECQFCRSHNVKRQVSLFNAASGGKVIAGSGGCSGCSGGSCSTCGTNK